MRWRRTRLAGCAMLLALLSLASLSVAAEQIKVTLDPAQTTVDWTLGDVLHTVHGTFKLKSGAVSFDPNSGAASGVILVDATTGESGNQARDKKMHKEILESQRYPEITFIPQRVIGNVPQNGNSTIQVQGLFHIHGSDHDLTLSVPVEIIGNEVKARTSFMVPYRDWGMKDPSTFLLRVEKTVTVNVSAVGHLVTSNSAPATH
jgi:polyisoprenoid-binding protein YceI